MKIKELLEILSKADVNQTVVISNILDSPLAVLSVDTVIVEKGRPVYIRALRPERF